MADTRIPYVLHRPRNGIECSSDRENDFAKSLIGFKTPMCILDLFEWEDRIDYGFDTFVGPQRDNVGFRCVSCRLGNPLHRPVSNTSV
jgi:hypothetical protein